MTWWPGWALDPGKPSEQLMCRFMSRSSQVQLSDPPLLSLVPFSVLFLLQVLDCYSLFSILTKDEGRMSRGALQSVWSLILMMSWESWL